MTQNYFNLTILIILVSIELFKLLLREQKITLTMYEYLLQKIFFK